ncbi:rCG63491, partial [Rattus norvegicus]
DCCSICWWRKGGCSAPHGIEVGKPQWKTGFTKLLEHSISTFRDRGHPFWKVFLKGLRDSQAPTDTTENCRDPSCLPGDKLGPLTSPQFLNRFYF